MATIEIRGRELLSPQEFRDRERRGGVKGGNPILLRTRRSTDGEIRGAFDGQAQTGDAGGRVLRYVISSERQDRHGDVVIQSGRDVQNYNGVVLWGHDYGCIMPPGPPIGRSLSIEDGNRRGVPVTIATASFAGLAQNHALAETVFLLARDGFIPDCSIGFSPIEWTYDEDLGGYKFLEWALDEWSLVPIGANLDVERLQLHAKTEGIDLGPLREWAEGALSFSGDILPVSKAKLVSIEKALRAVQERKTSSRRRLGVLGTMIDEDADLRFALDTLGETVRSGSAEEAAALDPAGEAPAEDPAAPEDPRPAPETPETPPVAEPEPPTAPAPSEQTLAAFLAWAEKGGADPKAVTRVLGKNMGLEPAEVESLFPAEEPVLMVEDGDTGTILIDPEDLKAAVAAQIGDIADLYTAVTGRLLN